MGICWASWRWLGFSKIAENGFSTACSSVSGDGNVLNNALAENFRRVVAGGAVMAVQEKCDEKSGVRSSCCAGIFAPTLRKVREGWGTRTRRYSF